RIRTAFVCPTSTRPSPIGSCSRAGERDSGCRLLSMPKCSGAVATTLSAAPAPLVLLYTKVVWCERVPVTTVVWNLEGGNLVAAVGARERNGDRAMSRHRDAATLCNVLRPFAANHTHQA